MDDIITQRVLRFCSNDELNIEEDIFKIEITTFAQNNCNYKNSEGFQQDTVCYDADVASNSVLECYQNVTGKYYGEVS